MSNISVKNGRKKAVVLLSGGLDSMVCAGIAKAEGYDIAALTIDYNQRHRVEIEAAKTIAAHIGVERHVVLPLDLRSFGGSALTSDDMDVPKNALESHGDGEKGDIPITYVPARNLVFLSLTLAWAEAVGAVDIFIGVNALDYSGYPDCRPEFISAFQDIARLATKAGDEGANWHIHAPLQMMSKAQIAEQAEKLGLDPGMSWSCYDPQGNGQGGFMACGQCDSCLLRKEGFKKAGLTDNSPYAA